MAVRRLLAVLVVAALSAPVAAGVCAGLVGSHCGPATQHSCCNTPRISSCDCSDPVHARPEAEPASTRPTGAAPVSALPAHSSTVVPPVALALAPHETPPPLAGCDRLALLSTLII